MDRYRDDRRSGSDDEEPDWVYGGEPEPWDDDAPELGYGHLLEPDAWPEEDDEAEPEHGDFWPESDERDER